MTLIGMYQFQFVLVHVPLSVDEIKWVDFFCSPLLLMLLLYSIRTLKKCIINNDNNKTEKWNEFPINKTERKKNNDYDS